MTFAGGEGGLSHPDDVPVPIAYAAGMFGPVREHGRRNNGYLCSPLVSPTQFGADVVTQCVGEDAKDAKALVCEENWRQHSRNST